MANAAPINPYEPPQAPPSSPLPVEVSGAGPWRDHALMVVRVHNSGPLPWRCVLTGVPVERNQFFWHELSYYPKANSFLLVRPVELAFYWPVVDAFRPWMVPPRLKQGVGIVSVGLGAIGVGIIPEIPTPIQAISFWSMIPFVVLIGIFTWIGRFLTRRFPSILRAQDGFAWVQGLHGDFLAELPPWPGDNPK